MTIVETPGTLSGRPRIDGTRIGVLQILSSGECGYTPEDIASKQYPHLTLEQVTEAIEWLYDHPERVQELRLDDLVATEQIIRRTTKPPMAIWHASTTFISEERAATDESDEEIITGLLLEPSSPFTRVFNDVLHESYTVYEIDLGADVATPINDDPHVTLSDAIDIAHQYASEEEGILIADQVITMRSVRLDELPDRAEYS